MAILQGSSAIVTPAKQAGLFGLHHMTLTAQKARYPQHMVIDAFCGSGLNVINDDHVDGSPITIIKATVKAIQSSRVKLEEGLVLRFSDVFSTRSLEMLPQHVVLLQQELGLIPDPNLLIIPTRFGMFKVPIFYHDYPFNTMLDRVERYLLSNSHAMVTMTIDPNGPKEIDFDHVVSLDKRFHHRLNQIFHISANHLKRVSGARDGAAAIGVNFRPLPDHIGEVVRLFRDHKNAWIRVPIGPDQWTILAVLSWATRNAWPGQGYHKTSAPEMQEHMTRMIHTAKQLKELELV